MYVNHLKSLLTTISSLFLTPNSQLPILCKQTKTHCISYFISIMKGSILTLIYHQSSSQANTHNNLINISLKKETMGNAAASCAPTMISSGVVKVILLDGRLEIYTRPIKAAELMLDHQRQFICDSADLKVGQPVHGVSADEELERRKLYFLLPMEMLYSVLTNEELDYLTDKAAKSLKHGSLNFAKIFPVLGEFCMFPSSEGKTRGDVVGRENVMEDVNRYSRQRSWIPALETIVETLPHKA